MPETTARRGETRGRILAAAGRLFRAHGVDGTGVDAVMREAGLTHGGFYLHFPSKEALAAEASHALLDAAARRWTEISQRPDRTAALRLIVGHYLEADRVASGQCCLLTTLGNDVARRPASRAAIGGALRGMLDALARCLPARRRNDAMAALSTLVGAVVLARLSDDPAQARAFLDAAASDVLSRVLSRDDPAGGGEASGKPAERPQADEGSKAVITSAGSARERRNG